MLMFDALNGTKPKKRVRLASAAAGVFMIASLGIAVPVMRSSKQDTGSALVEVLTSGKRSKDARAVTENTDARLLFAKDISDRIAIGSEEILKVEKVVSKRELTLKGVKVGATSLTVWFADNTVEQYMFTVDRDLHILEDALRSIAPTIHASIAPDRDAIVLTGTVPDQAHFVAAQNVAASYLSAGKSGGAGSAPIDPKKMQDKDTAEAKSSGQVINLLKVSAEGTPLEGILKNAVQQMGVKDGEVVRMKSRELPDDEHDLFMLRGQVDDEMMYDEVLAKADEIVSGRKAKDSGAQSRVISRIVVLNPKTDVILAAKSAIRAVGECASGVTVDYQRGIMILGGKVPNQTCLLRVLTIASRIVLERKEDDDKARGVKNIHRTTSGGIVQEDISEPSAASTGSDIKLIGDESGALKSLTGANSQLSSGVSSLFNSGGGGLGGSGGNIAGLLTNSIDSNIGRAKALELAGGRIVSFIEVTDLPQVRIDIRLYEVKRSALLTWNPSLKLGGSDFNTNGVNPEANFPPPLGTHDANGDTILGHTNTDVSGLLGFLGGSTTSEFKLGGSHVSVDALLNLLEKEGIGKTLSNPSLTVLSGEQAFFNVGGKIPIQQSFATTGIGSANGVLNSTQFIDFGIRLAVRPLIDDNDFITLDVVPSVSNPDAALTASIRASTGTNPVTTALDERSMRTSSRLRDGQTLLIGGLTEHARADDSGQTPGLHRIPLIGFLFKNFNYEDSDRELIIVVNPVIVRDRPVKASMWAFPDTWEDRPEAPSASEPAKAPAKDAPKPASSDSPGPAAPKKN